MSNFYIKIIRQATIILLICLPVLFNPFGFEIFALPRVIFLYFWILFIVLIFIFSLTHNSNFSIIYSNPILVLIPFIFFVFVSFLFSLDKQVALWGYVGNYEGIFSWLSYFFIFYVGYLFFRNKKELKQLFFILSFVAGMVGIYAITEYFGFWQLMEWSQKTEINRASSFLGHPIYLGTFFVLVLPLIFSLFTEDLSKKKKVILFINFGLSICGLVLSFSRGAWIALFIISFLFFIFNLKIIKQKISDFRKNYFKYFIFVIFLLSLFFLNIGQNDLWSLVFFRIKSIFDFSSPSVLVHNLLYRQSWSLLQDNWLLGVGPDNFVYIMPKYALNSWNVFKQATAEKAHNLFLDIWISFGIGGLISFLFFLFYWFKQSIIFLKKVNPNNQPIFQGIFYSIIGCLIAWQFHYSTIDLAPLFWFLLGAGVGFMVENGTEKEQMKIFNHRASWFKKILITSWIIIFFIFLVFSSKRILADYFFVQALESKNIDQSIFFVDKAIKHNSLLANYYLVANSYYLQKIDSVQYKQFLQQAIDSLIIASNKVPLDYRITYQLGETYLVVANYAQNKENLYLQAEKAYVETLGLYPNNTEANLKLGVVSAYLNKNEEALKFWHRCIEIDKKFSQCYYNLAVLYQKIGIKDQSDYYYKEFDKYK